MANTVALDYIRPSKPQDECTGPCGAPVSMRVTDDYAVIDQATLSGNVRSVRSIVVDTAEDARKLSDWLDRWAEWAERR